MVIATATPPKTTTGGPTTVPFFLYTRSMGATLRSANGRWRLVITTCDFPVSIAFFSSAFTLFIILLFSRRSQKERNIRWSRGTFLRGRRDVSSQFRKKTCHFLPLDRTGPRNKRSRSRNVRSRCRCSLSPAIHISSFLILWQGKNTRLSFCFFLFSLCGPPGRQSALFGIFISFGYL